MENLPLCKLENILFLRENIKTNKLKNIKLTMLITFLLYFAVLFLVSHLVGTRGNDAFFRGNRQSPWPLVAFGMVGASFSGVTFIGVPGMVMTGDMTYLQMCIGFFFGYLVVAFVLLPIYYRMGLTSIYGYLDKRFGSVSYKTGAWFFIVSKLSSSAAKFYVACLILQQFVEFFLYLVEFGFDIIVVVGYHGIDKDGVEETHEDDTAEGQQSNEVQVNQGGIGSSQSLTQGVGYFIPPLDGEEAESAGYAEQWV